MCLECRVATVNRTSPLACNTGNSYQARYLIDQANHRDVRRRCITPRRHCIQYFVVKALPCSACGMVPMMCDLTRQSYNDEQATVLLDKLLVRRLPEALPPIRPQITHHRPPKLCTGTKKAFSTCCTPPMLLARQYTKTCRPQACLCKFSNVRNRMMKFRPVMYMATDICRIDQRISSTPGRRRVLHPANRQYLWNLETTALDCKMQTGRGAYPRRARLPAVHKCRGGGARHRLKPLWRGRGPPRIHHPTACTATINRERPNGREKGKHSTPYALQCSCAHSDDCAFS